MGERTQYPPSTFCWVEFHTTDAATSKNFYTKVFGWATEDRPIGPDAVYTMLQKDGKHVAALLQMDVTMQAQGVPPHWRSYVSVEDVNAATERARELGGSVIAAPFDVMDLGRMAGVVDPDGAHFALWQPQNHHGAQLVNEPGCWCWNELQTRNPQGAVNFYSELLGWTAHVSASPSGAEYIEFRNSGYAAAGMIEIQLEWGSDVPPNWSVYFAVADLNGTMADATEAGAATHLAPMTVEGLGRFALLEDPTHAMFALIQMDEGVADD